MISRTILHVEDTEEDVFLLQYAFRNAEIPNPVHVVSDGQEAIDYLSGAGSFADRNRFPLPLLTLLDLKLPQRTGLEVLEWIRNQPPPISHLVVIMLTSSEHPGDVERAYQLGVNAFLVKPSDIGVFADVCRALKHFWIIHNTPPFTVRT